MKEGAGEDPFADDSTGDGSERSDASESARESPPDDPEPVRIPYKLRRDGVQDGRDRVPLFLQSDTKTAEREALRELEERFDDSVSLTDLRESLVKAGLDHLGEVEAQLEERGYGMTFDE